jgi:hypothetical protein
MADWIYDGITYIGNYRMYQYQNLEKTARQHFRTLIKQINYVDINQKQIRTFN